MRTEPGDKKGVFSVLIIALVIAFYLFCNSSFFETDSVEWTGLGYLQARHLDLYLDFSPVNVWRLDSRELSSALSEHPWISETKVKWRWPNRIIVRVQERTPVAQLPSTGGWLLLDKEGTLLPPPEGVFVFSLPIITNLDLESREQLVSTARLMSIIPTDLKDYISEWNAANRAFISRSGTEVLMGPPVELEQKFVLLGKILDDLASRGEHAVKIDLRVTKNPVVGIL
ncbi:MAG TPA: FtsQ-type POTRA domain-containing protein [Firmicutes bacterium]|nr:FtsQ-type POTRA domain-containing protein [Bacillota bacterium]